MVVLGDASVRGSSTKSTYLKLFTVLLICTVPINEPDITCEVQENGNGGFSNCADLKFDYSNEFSFKIVGTSVSKPISLVLIQFFTEISNLNVNLLIIKSRKHSKNFYKNLPIIFLENSSSLATLLF